MFSFEHVITHYALAPVWLEAIANAFHIMI
jgi:hypothetical protein